MPGAWLRPCISRLKPKIVFNSHTRANHPGWGLGRTVSLDKVQRTVGHLASNIIPFLWLYFESSFPKCYTMEVVVMLLSSGHTRGKRIIFCFCYCSYFSRIFVCLPFAVAALLLLAFCNSTREGCTTDAGNGVLQEGSSGVARAGIRHQLCVWWHTTPRLALSLSR